MLLSELSQENWELLQENERAGVELALLREERGALDTAYAEVRTAPKHGIALVVLCQSVQLTATPVVCITLIVQLSRHSEGLQNKIENLEQVFTTGDEYAQQQRPMTGSDWGMLSNPATPRAGVGGGRKHREAAADDAADALLRRAGAY